MIIKNSDIIITHHDMTQKTKKQAPDGKAAYSSILAESAATAKGWRLCTILSICVAALAVGFVGYIGSQSKIQPVLVVMKDDYIPVGIFSNRVGVKVTDENLIKATLAQLIRSYRTVSVDNQYQQALVKQLAAYVQTNSPAFSIIQETLSQDKTNPFFRSRTVNVEVAITNVLKISGSTWQVDWVERIFTHDGAELGSEVYRANMTFTFSSDINSSNVLLNPIGLLISSLNITRVNN